MTDKQRRAAIATGIALAAVVLAIFVGTILRSVANA